ALVAIILPRSAAAVAVARAWDAGEAVAVLDPTAPPGVQARLLDLLRPTHVLDEDGRRDDSGGVGVAGDTAAVVVTSGTTAAPKGVELTTNGLETMGAGFAAAFGTPATDRWLVCLPLHHVAGLAILARARVSGAGLVVHDGFDLGAVASSPATEQTTLVSLVPTMLHRLLAADAPLHSFRRIVTGGAPLPPAVRAHATAAGAQVVDAYGMSETWGGILLDGTPIAGAAVTLGDDAEVLVRGPMVMRAYRLRPDETAAAFTPDGWLRTGDIGVQDPDGSVRIVDRQKDLVISGGVNVSPRAVEEALADHPDIDDVAVAGTADAEWGERVVAYVVPRDPRAPVTLAELRSFGSESLGAAALPRELVLVDAIPRTTGGKILRRELRRPT
ncbi:MAG: fatty acid--CoA ligase family protein, partial [Acidimicrobiia bacterium]|nr:fatty acid--CoA ligase family protein [Acidimicrobiia bacterium]